MDLGIKTDPAPYILAAYMIAALLLVGYSLWQWQERKKLRLLEAAFREGGKSS